jgi:hypothetical protein
MAENNKEHFTNPPPLRQRFPLLPAERREQALLRAESINTAAITKMREACSKIDHILADIQVNPEAKRAVTITASREIYIKNVVDLVQTLSNIINKIGFILNIFKAPYATLTENGLPEHNGDNTAKVRANLMMAILQLKQIGIDPKKAKEDLTPLAPDNALIEKLDKLNRTKESFESMRADKIVEIMTILEEYLNSVISAVKLGVAFNVEATRAQLEQLEEVAGLTAIQTEEDELFGFTDNTNAEKDWHDLLYEIEFTLANFAVKIMEIYRPVGVWTLKKIEVRALQNFTRQIETKVEYLEKKLAETVSAASGERNFLERVRDSVKPGSRALNRPSVTDIQTGRIELAEAKGMLESLRKILRIRSQI